MGDHLTEGSLIGLVYGNSFLEFSVTSIWDSERFRLKLLIIDIKSNGLMIIGMR